MKRKMRIWWAVASAVWVLLMMNMSFHDLKYSLQYHLQRDRVDAAFQAKVAAYERDKQAGEEHIRMLLQAAKRYEDLQFLSLAAKRTSRPIRIADSSDGKAGEAPKSDYQRYRGEIAVLEQTYGKATLRKYREPDQELEQGLHKDLRERLIIPQMREPRLAAILFHMLASPLVLLLALWFHEKGYRKLPVLRRYLGIGR
jgi:PHD/YefM family antitoxin component YafN of YafNO toxin-antitoxin module